MQSTAAATVRVLVVEDDVKLAGLLTRGLSECGMAVEAAPTGEDALEHLEAHAFDVVVLDVMLPNMNGLEVCRRLRATGSTAAIVFLTARWDLEVRERSVVAGASDFFPKPFSLDELAARLLELGARRND